MATTHSGTIRLILSKTGGKDVKKFDKEVKNANENAAKNKKKK